MRGNSVIGLLPSMVLIIGLGALASTPALAQTVSVTGPNTRAVIKTQNELPRHSYILPGTAEQLLSSDDATFNAWAAKVAADADETLRNYDIADAAAKRKLLGTRLFYEMLAGKNDVALDTVRHIRALEEKADAKWLSGLRYEAILQARIDTGASTGPVYEGRYALLYHDKLAAVPFDAVAPALKELKSRTEILSVNRTKAYIATEVQPKIAKDHTVADKAADDILWARTFRTIEAPLKPLSVKALAQIVAENQVEKPDIWATRDVTLTPNDPGSPVTVAIWDSGVDTTLFPGRLYKAANHSPGNPTGLSFDVESRPSAGVLRPLTKGEAEAYRRLLVDMRGFSDMQAGADSPTADALKAKLSELSANENAAYWRKLTFYGDYAHGTHVAGIAARGNPFIRLAVIRDTEDYRAVPPPPTELTVSRRIALYRTVSSWLKANKVRVVNMSWGDYPASYENDLEKNGIGKNATDRKRRAHRYFEQARAAFVELLANNPDTVFIASAGNSDSDNGFDESYPSAVTAPNLIVVSAADQAGDETRFTSYGKNVVVSANGYQVRSVVPGGTELLESGTSAAAPNVTNLAAKLIALKPSLSVAQTVDLIVRGATPSTDGRRRNIDPQASVRALRGGG